MKAHLIYFIASFILFTSFSKPTEISAEEVVHAISNENYVWLESVIKSKQLNPNFMIEGKTLLIHAVFYDKAEMVNLLVRNGANLEIEDSNGNTPYQCALKWNKIHALAEIIVITA